MLLALDTATATASLALYDLEMDQLLAEYSWLARRRHTQDLLNTAQQLLRQLDRSPRDLTGLAVTTGPGSFTGVRIAISVVKGIAMGLPDVPRLVAVPTLSVTAAPWLALAGTMESPARICAYIQAGRGRYNWAFFGPDDLLRCPAVDEHEAGHAAQFADRLARLAPRTVWLVGEPAPDLQEATAHLSHVCLVDGVSSLRRAGQLARLAVAHLRAGHESELATLQPLYLRNP